MAVSKVSLFSFSFPVLKAWLYSHQWKTRRFLKKVVIKIPPRKMRWMYLFICTCITEVFEGLSVMNKAQTHLEILSCSSVSVIWKEEGFDWCEDYYFHSQVDTDAQTSVILRVTKTCVRTRNAPGLLSPHPGLHPLTKFHLFMSFTLHCLPRGLRFEVLNHILNS